MKYTDKKSQWLTSDRTCGKAEDNLLDYGKKYSDQNSLRVQAKKLNEAIGCSFKPKINQSRINSSTRNIKNIHINLYDESIKRQRKLDELKGQQDISFRQQSERSLGQSVSVADLSRRLTNDS